MDREATGRCTKPRTSATSAGRGFCDFRDATNPTRQRGRVAASPAPSLARRVCVRRRLLPGVARTLAMLSRSQLAKCGLGSPPRGHYNPPPILGCFFRFP